MASLSKDLDLIRPHFDPSSHGRETPASKAVIKSLSLIPHIEGGYFAVTDMSETKIPSPYPRSPLSQKTIDLTGGLQSDFDYALRRLSTTIFYYLTPARSHASFHRNRSRIIHTLHKGRGRYVLIHPDGQIETFVVGKNVEKGERLQWVVKGDVWKASFLLPLESDGPENALVGENGPEADGGLLISETVVPGFEYADHEFLTSKRCEEIVPPETARRIEWLVGH